MPSAYIVGVGAPGPAGSIVAAATAGEALLHSHIEGSCCHPYPPAATAAATAAAAAAKEHMMHAQHASVASP